MTGWNIDVAGLSTLLTSLDTEVADLRTAVSGVTSALAGCSAAVSGPVSQAWASFVAERRTAPQELVTMSDQAARAAVGSAAAFATGQEEMATNLSMLQLDQGPFSAISGSVTP